MGFMDEYRKLREEDIAKKASEASSSKGSSGSSSSHGGGGGSFNSIGSFESHMQNKTNVRSGIDAPLGNKYTPNLVNVSSRLTKRMTVGMEKKDEDKQEDHPVRDKVNSRLTVDNKKDEEEDDDKKWYQKGHFEDGWDFGDITKTILGVPVKKELKTFEAPDTTDSLEVLKQKSDYYNSRLWNNTEQLAASNKYTQQYNQMALAEYSETLSKTKMDGTNHTVLDEIEILANMKSGKEKNERKQAVLDKMESLGMDTTFYAHFAGDGEFNWSDFGNWIKSSAYAGMGSFNKMFTDTADVLLGAPLKEMGWENNPVSKLNEHYTQAYENAKYSQQLYAEKLGGGAWNFGGDAVEGTVAALPSALLAMMTGGTSLTATSSSLATNAAYQTGSVLTKAGITAETMMKNPQYWTSFAQSLGPKYKEAKEKGVNDSVAAVGAVISSMLTSGIEIGIDGGSGIQGLPSDLLEEGGSKFLKLLETAYEEGGEEGLQKLVDEGVSKFLYGLEDDYLNPIEYGKDMTLGTIAGLALGSGQVASQSAVDAIAKRNTVKDDIAPGFDSLKTEATEGFTPTVEQTPKVEQEIKPEVEEVKPVVEEVNPVVEQTDVKPPKKTLYTGSANTDIKQFKVGGVDGSKQTGDRYGRGVYLTTNESTAKNYAGDNGRVYQINADDLNIFDLNDTITPEMRDSLVAAFNGGDKQFRNSMLRNFRTEMTFDDFKSAEAFFDQQRKVWKEQDGEYAANKPVIKDADYETGKAVIEFTDFENWENNIGTLTGNHLYDALKSLSTDDFSSFITGHGFDGIAFDEDSDNQQYVIYRNEDRLRIDEPVAENAPVEEIAPAPTVSETETVETGVDTGNNNPQLDRMIAERDSLQETLMDRYRNQLYDDETERLANEWSKLNYQIGNMNAEQASADTDTPIAEETDASNFAPAQQSEEKPKFVPKIEKSTPAQSIFKTRALDVESLPNHAKEKVKGKYKALERATDAATTLLMHGNDTLRPVHEIFEDISKVGDVEDFNSYIYHKLNPERIAQDKDVHRGVSAETSQEYVKHLAENNPEFEKYAQEIYDWCDYMLNLQVASKRITQETADRWKTMYPSFAPIRRSGFTDDLKIAEMLGLVLENQGNILETDFAEEVVEAIEKTDPLSKEKKTTGGKKPILPLQDTLAERVVQVHWAAALNSDLFDVADTKTKSKPEHALYVDDVLQYVDNFENPFTDKDFTFDKRNDNHMRSRFSKEELSRLAKETNELIDIFNSGNFTSEHRAKLNEDYVLHDLQVVRNKMESLNKWLDRINGELAHDKAELSELKQKEEDLLVSHYTFTSSSVDRLQSEYSNRIKILEARVEAGENKLRNATHYVKEQTGRYSYSDKLDWKKKTEHTYSLKELETAYVGMLSFDKPKSRQPVSDFSSGTTFIDSNTQYDGDQIAPEPFVEEETYVEESPTVEYDEPKFTNPKDAKFDFDGNDKKLGKTSMFMDHFVDKGAIFEKLGRETNNDELAAKWDFIRKTYNATQYMIGKGVDGIKSVNKVFTDVDKLGIAEEFDDYLRLMAHWDGMTVKMRYGFPKNRAFLNTDLEAYKAKDQARELEERFPQFAELADDIYQNMAHLRSEMVDAGLMTQKDADFIAEVYPHFVPVRYNQDGTAISVFDSIATQMMNVKRACATNKFSGELLGTLNTAVPLEGIDSYDILNRFAGSPNLFELGEFGNYPTYTFYDNGRKVNYAVSIQMKEALTNSHPGLNARIPVFAGANDLFRAVTTEYNVPFHASNFIRDAKSVLLNSQHAAKTYMNYPRALKEIVTKGKYYQEYLENGGGSNTYFDTKKRVFTSSKKTLRDFPPLALISKGGNVIESLPRLSEFIVDREMGKSVEKSMLDASRVTTNFGAGGDVTRFIDRNGATFLNASVQGFTQTVRNFQDAKAKGLMGYGVLGAKLMLMGLSHALLDEIVWGDDEDYQNLPDYIKESYDIVGKTNSGRFIRIPKDRTQACIDNAYDQIKDALTGDDDIDLLEFGRIFVANLAPNNFLDDNIFAPIRQVRNNKAWYGDDLVPSRLQDLPESEQFDDKTDAISRYLGEKFDYSPYKINYLMNSYGGGLADVVLPFLTPRAESGSDSILGKVLNPFRDKFTTDPVLNNRVTDDFYAKVDELQSVANSEDATEEDKLIASYMLSESSDISDLWEKRREIQSSDLPDSTKFERMREVKEEINNRMFDALDSYEDVKITGRYATIDGHRFNKDDSGKWWELKPKKSDGTDNGYYTNEQEHLKVLGITPEQYWNNQEYYHEQYNMAIYRPGEYALTEVFGGYDDYLRITDDWSELVTGKNDRGQWNTTVNKKTVGKIIYDLDLPEIEKHILYKSIYNYTDTHNRKILEYLDSRDDITWNEMKKIVIELGFTVDENDDIHW